ncbi:hypothetical protein YC2023_051902 [Brassica napus]
MLMRPLYTFPKHPSPSKQSDLKFHVETESSSNEKVIALFPETSSSTFESFASKEN